MSSEFHFRLSIAAALAVISLSLLAFRPAPAQENASRIYLGFDVNEYPGDPALPALRKTFAFAGYWLNVPPGADGNNWTGQRAEFTQKQFRFPGPVQRPAR